MELVEHDRGLRRVLARGVAERFPHVHHRQFHAAGLFLADIRIKRRHAGLGTIRAAEPDRSLALEVADHDAVAVSLLHRDFVDAQVRGAGRAGLRQLRLHVLLLQRLHAVPVQVQFLGHRRDRFVAAASPDVVREALGVERTVRQEVQGLALHGLAVRAADATDLELQEDAVWPARHIPHPPRAPVVPAGLLAPAGAAACFFERRTSVTTRACGSPNTPFTSSSGRKPGTRYASSRRFLQGLDRIAA